MREKRQSFCRKTVKLKKNIFTQNSTLALSQNCHVRKMFQWKKTLSESVSETKATTQWKCFVSFGVLFQISDSKLFQFVLMLQSISTGTKRRSKIFFTLLCYASKNIIKALFSMDPFLDLSSLYRALFGSLDRSYNFTCVCQFVRPLVESFSKLNTPKSDGPDFFENSFLSKCWPNRAQKQGVLHFFENLVICFS